MEAEARLNAGHFTVPDGECFLDAIPQREYAAPEHSKPDVICSLQIFCSKCGLGASTAFPQPQTQEPHDHKS